jgi:hypothetical protein
VFDGLTGTFQPGICFDKEFVKFSALIYLPKRAVFQEDLSYFDHVNLNVQMILSKGT